MFPQTLPAFLLLSVRPFEDALHAVHVGEEPESHVFEVLVLTHGEHDFIVRCRLRPEGGHLHFVHKVVTECECSLNVGGFFLVELLYGPDDPGDVIDRAPVVDVLSVAVEEALRLSDVETLRFGVKEQVDRGRVGEPRLAKDRGEACARGEVEKILEADLTGDFFCFGGFHGKGRTVGPHDLSFDLN